MFVLLVKILRRMLIELKENGPLPLKFLITQLLKINIDKIILFLMFNIFCSGLFVCYYKINKFKVFANNIFVRFLYCNKIKKNDIKNEIICELYNQEGEELTNFVEAFKNTIKEEEKKYTNVRYNYVDISEKKKQILIELFKNMYIDDKITKRYDEKIKQYLRDLNKQNEFLFYNVFCKFLYFFCFGFILRVLEFLRFVVKDIIIRNLVNSEDLNNLNDFIQTKILKTKEPTMLLIEEQQPIDNNIVIEHNIKAKKVRNEHISARRIVNEENLLKKEISRLLQDKNKLIDHIKTSQVEFERLLKELELEYKKQINKKEKLDSIFTNIPAEHIPNRLKKQKMVLRHEQSNSFKQDCPQGRILGVKSIQRWTCQDYDILVKEQRKIIINSRIRYGTDFTRNNRNKHNHKDNYRNQHNNDNFNEDREDEKSETN